MLHVVVPITIVVRCLVVTKQWAVNVRKDLKGWRRVRNRDEQRERPQTRVNAATVVLPFPVDPKVEDQGFSGDLLDLIDVTPPYLRLADFGVRRATVIDNLAKVHHCILRPTSIRHSNSASQSARET